MGTRLLPSGGISIGGVYGLPPSYMSAYAASVGALTAAEFRDKADALLERHRQRLAKEGYSDATVREISVLREIGGPPFNRATHNYDWGGLYHRAEAWGVAVPLGQM